MEKFNATVELARKHSEYDDYDIDVYKADVIKLLRYIDKLIEEKKYNEFLIGRINKKLSERLEQQKKAGKKFINAKQIDALIDKIIDEENAQLKQELKEKDETINKLYKKTLGI